MFKKKFQKHIKSNAELTLCLRDDYMLLLFTFMLLHFFTFAAGTERNQYAHTHRSLTCIYVWDDKHMATERLSLTNPRKRGLSTLSVQQQTHIHTHIPVLFKEVQLNVMLNIISLPTFINFPLYRKAGKASIDRDLPRLWWLQPISAAAQCNSSL